jgi:hypothetical protein
MVSPVELQAARMMEYASKNNFPLPREALFDRANDPLELHNLVSEDATNLAKMRSLATDLRRESGWPNGNTAPVDPQLKERLEAMGYWVDGK